jgi:hypothetical protein
MMKKRWTKIRNKTVEGRKRENGQGDNVEFRREQVKRDAR